MMVSGSDELVQSRLIEIFEKAPAFIATLRGPDHVFEMANPAYEQLVGRQGFLGMGVREVLPEVAEQGFVDILDRVFSSGEPFVASEMPVQLRQSSDGSLDTRYLNFAFQPLRDADDAISGILVHGVDVTDLGHARRMAEEQATELEAQAEELENQAAQLEEIQVELESNNEELAGANQAAQSARRRLEAVLQQMPSGVILAESPSGRLILGNDRVDRIWRRAFQPSSTIAEYHQYEAYFPDGRRYRPEDWPIARSLRGELVMGEEIEIIRGDGSRGVITMNSAPVHDEDGEIVAAVTIFDDVTEQKQHDAELAFLVEAARELTSSLEYRKTLLSVARLAVPRIADWCAVDILEDGVPTRLAVVHSDPEKERLAEEVFRRWPSDPDSPGGLQRVLRTGEKELYTEITDEHLKLIAQDEEHLQVLREVGLRSAMTLPMVAGGRTLGAISLVFAESGRNYDETDLALAEKLASRAAIAIENARLYDEAHRARRDAEQAQLRAEEAQSAAEAASSAKSDFLAKMSHEIRTPLNAVIGYSDLLHMGISGPLTEKQSEQLDRIRTSSQHLLGLIDEILDLARVESGRMDVRQNQARVADSVATALELVRVQADSRGIELIDNCTYQDSMYVGDEDRVRQILVNLVGNAIKFSEEGSAVELSCGTAEFIQGRPKERGPWTFIRVRDSGIGIAPEQKESIFHPFMQVQGGYTREAGGTGLGLTISRQLAILMGGDITVESEQGSGSTFTLWLPDDTTEQDAAVWEGVDEVPPRGLDQIGAILLAEVDTILNTYRMRLREDEEIPYARDQTDAALEDHHSSLVSDFGAGLVVLSQAGEARDHLMRDGSQIQRTVADLHGRQRAQLGWTEGALAHEFRILGEVIAEQVHSSADRREIDVEGGLELLKRFVDRAERISIRGHRIASTSSRLVRD